MALLAACMVPGLGHVLLGRVRRGVLFAVLILGSFGLGVAHDGRFGLRNDREAFLSTLQIIANAGVGPVDMLGRSRVYGELCYALPSDLADPAYETRLRILRGRTRSPLSIYGTAYLWTAGLMNLLLLFDVWDISRGAKE